MQQAIRVYGKARNRLRLDASRYRGLGLSGTRLKDWWVSRKAGSIIWFEMYLLAFFGFARDIVGLPSSVTYLFDLINTFLFVAILVRGKYDNKGRYYPYAIGWILLFLFTTAIGALIAGNRAILYLWGFRNTFRTYVFFVCCVALLGVQDIPRIVLFFKRLFFVNIALCILEYGMGYSGDFIGGSFGMQQGGNSYLNLLFIISLALYINEYLSHRTSLFMLVTVLLLCCFVIAIAELKAFFFELPAMVALAVFLERPTARSMILLVVMVLGVAVGLFAMQIFFSEYGINFYTSGAVMKYMGDSGYTNTGDLSRLNAVRRITHMFFERDPLKLLFGFGLGNCSGSNFAVLTSWFYNHYSALHYMWFSDANVYLETGLIGLFFFESFFVLIFIISRLKRYKNPDLRVAVNCVSIIAPMAIYLSVYDGSMTLEAGYMAYLFFASPFILDKYRRPCTAAAKDVSEKSIVGGAPARALRSGEGWSPCES